MARDNAQCTAGCLLAIALAAIPGIYFLVATSLDIRGLVNGNGNVVGEDFAQIWLGGRLALEGRIHDVFVPELFKAAARAEFAAAPHVPQIFSYPPTTLLPAAVLALVPYPVALALWSLLQVGLFTTALLLATRGFLATRLALLIAVTAPALALTLPWGQFGAIIAALMTMGVLLLDRRPALAGVLLALMAVKPQFGVLVPVALLAGQHWRAFAAAGLTVAGMGVLSVLAFGIGAWADFLQVTLPAQVAITSDPSSYLPIAHSIRDRLVIAGLDPTAARIVQALLGWSGVRRRRDRVPARHAAGAPPVRAGGRHGRGPSLCRDLRSGRRCHRRPGGRRGGWAAGQIGAGGASPIVGVAGGRSLAHHERASAGRALRRAGRRPDAAGGGTLGRRHSQPADWRRPALIVLPGGQAARVRYRTPGRWWCRAPAACPWHR